MERQTCLTDMLSKQLQQNTLLIALLVLVVPHTNAGEERVFSTIKKHTKIKIEFEGSHNAHKTVNSRAVASMVHLGAFRRVIKGM